MVKNLPASVGDMDSSGKIPHTAEQLNLCTTNTEAVLRKKRNHHSEKPVHCI